MIAIVKTDRLAHFMFQKGWTRRALAKASGIGEITAQQICAGKRNPSPPVAKKVADALGVEVDEIFEIGASTGKDSA